MITSPGAHADLHRIFYSCGHTMSFARDFEKWCSLCTHLFMIMHKLKGTCRYHFKRWDYDCKFLKLLFNLISSNFFFANHKEKHSINYELSTHLEVYCGVGVLSRCTFFYFDSQVICVTLKAVSMFMGGLLD